MPSRALTPVSTGGRSAKLLTKADQPGLLVAVAGAAAVGLRGRVQRELAVLVEALGVQVVAFGAVAPLIRHVAARTPPESLQTGVPPSSRSKWYRRPTGSAPPSANPSDIAMPVTGIRHFFVLYLLPRILSSSTCYRGF